MVGTADNCACIPPAQFSKETSMLYLIPGETAMIYLKATVEEHIFTDMAYIQIKGDAAVGKKRLVRRIEFMNNTMTNVMFETGGTGITDQDCEIKFSFGGESFSIDVHKREMETAKMYYVALAGLSRAQQRNDLIYGTTMSLASKVVVNPGDFGGTMIGLGSTLVANYKPESYKKVIESFLLR
jgi:hypothetical protein